MTRSPVDHADPPSSTEEAGGAAPTPHGTAGEPDRIAGEPDRTAGATDDAIVEADRASDDQDLADADDEVRPFGEQPATRVAADVEYRGRAGEHDYVVRVRHRLLDTSFTVVIDGIEHDPEAEEKARKARAKKAAKDGTQSDDGLQFGLDEGFSTLRCTVRRRADGEDTDDEDADGEVEDGEVITIRTAGLGGAGEVDVRHGLRTTPLVPAEGSPSAARDAKRTAHPTRYALIAALTMAATFLIPLLGFGALFSGLLDPLKQWVEDRIRPVVEAVVQATQPIRDWIGEVTRPVREFLDALLSPIRDLIAAILRPIDEALRWLLGLLPDIGLDVDVPDWLVDVLVPVLVVVVVFVATYSRLRNRRAKLAETAGGAEPGTSEEAEAGISGEAKAGASGEAGAETSGGVDAEGEGECEGYGAETPEASSQEVPSREARNEARSAGESSRQN
jgi:hypothetical protein